MKTADYAAVAVLLGLLLPNQSTGQFQVGEEFLVNTTTTDSQHPGGVAVDELSGNFVVVWLQTDEPGGVPLPEYGPHFQLYDPGAVNIGGEVLVSGPNLQLSRPTVASLGTGTFMIVWVDGELKARQYSFTTGAPLGGEAVLEPGLTVGNSDVHVAPTGSGGFIVAFRSIISPVTDEIYLRHYSSGGLPLGAAQQVSPPSTDNVVQDLACDEIGKCLVSWLELNTNTHWVRGFDASTSTLVAPAFQVQAGFVSGVQIAISGSGKTLLTGDSGEFYDSPHGTLLGPAFSLGVMDRPDDVVALPGDEFVVFAHHRAMRISSGGGLSAAFPFPREGDSIISFAQGGALPGDAVVATWSDGDAQHIGVFGRMIKLSLPSAVCASTPVPGCRVAAKSKLKEKFGNLHEADEKLKFNWANGPSTPLLDFGDPTVDATYALCVYDTSGLVVASEAPAASICRRGKPCWKAIGESDSKGFKYSNPDAGGNGIKKVRLKPSTDGKAKLIVVGKDGNLLLDFLRNGSTSYALPVVAQVVNSSNSVCWESVFTAAELRVNDEREFKAKR